MSKTIAKVNVKNALDKRAEFLKLAKENLETIESVHISQGNSKMGIIPSFSVMPLLTCTNCGECSKYCYACKGCFNFNSNIMNLAENTALLDNDWNMVSEMINKYLNNGTTIYKYFRWNVAGDVYSIDYLNLIINVANANPWTRFLVFTKNYKLFNDFLNDNVLPDNVVVVFSQWSNTPIDNVHNLPIAIVNIPGETSIPNGSFKCSGNCAECLECWNATNGTTRYFDLH